MNKKLVSILSFVTCTTLNFSDLFSMEKHEERKITITVPVYEYSTPSNFSVAVRVSGKRASRKVDISVPYQENSRVLLNDVQSALASKLSIQPAQLTMWYKSPSSSSFLPPFTGDIALNRVLNPGEVYDLTGILEVEINSEQAQPTFPKKDEFAASGSGR